RRGSNGLDDVPLALAGEKLPRRLRRREGRDLSTAGLRQRSAAPLSGALSAARLPRRYVRLRRRGRRTIETTHRRRPERPQPPRRLVLDELFGDRQLGGLLRQ